MDTVWCLFFLLWFVKRLTGIWMGRKSLAISRRVNSRHLLFIGEGRTGAKSLFLRHGKPKPKYWFRFFVCVWRGIWAIAIVVKRRYIRSEQTWVCVFADRRKNSPVDYFAGGSREANPSFSATNKDTKTVSFFRGGDNHGYERVSRGIKLLTQKTIGANGVLASYDGQF